MYTWYERKKYTNKIACGYCGKEFFEIGTWGFSIDYHEKVREALANDKLICTCIMARKELKLRRIMEDREHELEELKQELEDMRNSEEPF